jgi:hypothetical protein
MDGYIMRILIIVVISLLSFNVNGGTLRGTQSPVTDFIEQYGLEGSFTIMQGKSEFKALVGTMTNGKRDGQWTYYFPQSDQIWSVEKYSNGRPNGVWILYYPDGRIKTRDDLNKKRNDSFNRPSPACMGAAKGYHSEACIGNIKNNRALSN